MAVSLDHYANANNNAKAHVLGEALDEATEQLLENKKGPSRKAGELDNRGSHFYLAMYWAEELAKQTADAELKAEFAPIAEALRANEDAIVNGLNEIQGRSMNIDGYYMPDDAKASDAMRPNKIFNDILNQL